MPPFAAAIKESLFTMSKLTPFAWMALLGACWAAAGALGIWLHAKSNARFRHRRDVADHAIVELARPGRPLGWLSTFSFLENAFYIFLSGMLLLTIGAYPFAAAASAAAAP